MGARDHTVRPFVCSSLTTDIHPGLTARTTFGIGTSGHSRGSSASSSHSGTKVSDLHPGCQCPSDNAAFSTVPKITPTSEPSSPYPRSGTSCTSRRFELRFKKELGAALRKRPIKCRWYALDTVVKSGVHRGDIQWYNLMAASGSNSTFSACTSW